MIKLLKNHFYVIVLLGLLGCSSNTNVGQDDLSIAEIEDIEKTGEFSEDDFFKDEEILRENNVKVDIEGLDDKNLAPKDEGLVSDLDVEDFEGEGFDQEDDFETDLEGSGSVAEFDEFDEFVTNDKVAKNEDIIKNEPPKIGDIAEEPTVTEEDIFSEFEESTDIAKNDSSLAEEGFSIDDSALGGTTAQTDTTQPEIDFDQAFEESAPTYDTQANNDSPNVDTTLDTDIDVSEVENSARNKYQDIAEDSGQNTFDSDFGPGAAPDTSSDIDIADIPDATEERTAKEILGTQYEQPQQIVTQIARTVRSWIPVKKMRSEPYRKNGILLNALYIVREGDSFRAIADKIYGVGSTANLSQLNPYLNPKKLKVGEKVYYNSPNRPNDENTMLFYYDDIGRAAQYRQVETGENIRVVAKDLLGHPRSWMEIWATNPELVSKDEAERPYRIKYFSKNGEQSMVKDSNEPNASGSFDENQANMEPEPVEQPDSAMEVQTDNAATMEEPVVPDQAAVDPDFDKGFEDAPVNTDQVTDFDKGFEDPVMAENQPQQDGIGSIPESLNVFKEAGGLKKLYMGMDQKTIETVAMGAGGLVLLIILLMIVRRRRQYARATQVHEFDFTGSTKIDEQTKTHIDI